MTHHTDILRGAAELLGANDFGVYRESGVYQPDERGIVIAAFPETPREILSVAIYAPEYTGFSPTAKRQLTATRLQVRWRQAGNPLDGIETFDRLRALIHRQQLTLGPVQALGKYLSFSPMGQDANDRWSFTSNWQLSALEAI
jgi:hypothetical protein